MSLSNINCLYIPSHQSVLESLGNEKKVAALKLVRSDKGCCLQCIPWCSPVDYLTAETAGITGHRIGCLTVRSCGKGRGQSVRLQVGGISL